MIDKIILIIFINKLRQFSKLSLNKLIHNFKVIPITLSPSFFLIPATVEESTPPDIATTTVVSEGFLSKPIEFKSLFIRWYLYLFTI